MVDSLDLNKHIGVLQGSTNKSSTNNPANNLVTQTETMEPLANPAPNASENRVQTANGTWKQVAQNNLMYVKALSNGTKMAVSDVNNVRELEPKRDTPEGPRYYEHHGEKVLIEDNQAVIRRKSNGNADVVEIITFDSKNKQTILKCQFIDKKKSLTTLLNFLIYIHRISTATITGMNQIDKLISSGETPKG